MHKRDVNDLGVIADDAAPLSTTTFPAEQVATELTRLLAQQRMAGSSPSPHGVTIGRLLGLIDNGRAPLVALPGDALCAGIRARSTVDLHAAHVGRDVVLAFEQADTARPIIVGVLQDPRINQLPDELRQVDVAADGQRVIVTAETELVLQCGKARLTLRRDGTIELVGETILTRATGANRVKGGSVQLN